MRDWNVVATARDGCYRRARELLSSVCEHTERTHYKNVLIGRTQDPVALMEALHGDPGGQKLLGRVVPLRTTFVFQRAEDLDEAMLAAAAELAPELTGKSFHVRFHRRGFRGRVRSIDEEQRMDAAIVRATSELGRPARVSFDTPDAIVVVETIDNRGGISIWTKEQLERFPLLHLD